MQTFDFEPDMEEITDETYYLNERTDLQTGMIHVRNLQPEAMMTWTLTFQELTTKAAQIKAFYDARKGDYETFLWTSPIDNVKYCVKFNGKFTRRMKVRGIHYFSLKLERDLSATVPVEGGS